MRRTLGGLQGLGVLHNTLKQIITCKAYNVVGITGSTNALKPEDVHRSRWMGELRPIIGDKKLGDIVIPATHDSGTSGINENSLLIDRNFLFQLGKVVSPNVIANWSRNQDKELEIQLQAGYRFFDLRIADV